ERDHLRTRLGLQLSPHVGLAAGILPELGPEVGIGVGVTMSRLSLTVNAEWGPLQRATLPGASNMGGKLWSGSLDLRGCWAFHRQALSAGPCVGASITRLEGDGFGIAHPQTAVVHFVSPLAAAQLDWRIHSKFVLRLLVMGLFPTDRPKVFIDDLGDVHHPAWVNGRAQIGAVIPLR
ncbi:MAG TPA: hypothetical protein VKP30_15540, partial [Polyangiaceae bacterium]|nr:hypothetical protein [Polyangiaceae bacterium]